MRRWVPGGLALLAAAAFPAPARGEPGLMLARAFTVTAEAFPVEPAPGANRTTLGIRPVSTRAGASNPPAAAFARAAASDLGLMEAYVGPQGPAAEADTASANGRPDASVSEGGMTLDAHANRSPRGWATAVGHDGRGASYAFGSSRAWSEADGSGGALVAVASAEVHDIVSGPLVIGSARFDGLAASDGTREGARATGRVTASDATVGGVPVVVDDQGLRVDQAAVPAEHLPTLTEAVRSALNRGGYLDVRVVQPVTEVSDDGLRASVKGGGVRVRIANDDPTNNYFLELNFVAGAASVFLGPVIGAPSPGPGRVPGLATGTFEDVVSLAPRYEPFAAGPVAAAPAAGTAEVVAAPPELVAVTDAARYPLPGRWPGWPWALAGLAAAFALVAALGTPPLAPARSALSLLADRYVRG